MAPFRQAFLAVDAESDAELILAQSHHQRTLGERDEARRRSGNLAADGGGREQAQRQHLHDGSSGSGMGSALAAVKIALPPTRHKRSILTGAAKSAHPSSGANKRSRSERVVDSGEHRYPFRAVADIDVTHDEGPGDAAEPDAAYRVQ